MTTAVLDFSVAPSSSHRAMSSVSGLAPTLPLPKVLQYMKQQTQLLKFGMNGSPKFTGIQLRCARGSSQPTPKILAICFFFFFQIVTQFQLTQHQFFWVEYQPCCCHVCTMNVDFLSQPQKKFHAG